MHLVEEEVAIAGEPPIQEDLSCSAGNRQRDRDFLPGICGDGTAFLGRRTAIPIHDAEPHLTLCGGVLWALEPGKSRKPKARAAQSGGIEDPGHLASTLRFLEAAHTPATESRPCTRATRAQAIVPPRDRSRVLPGSLRHLRG